MAEDSLTLRQICRELGKVQHKANKLGKELGIPPQKMKEFEQGDDTLALIIDCWLKGEASKVPVTWMSLITALKSANVKENEVAEKIQAKFCSSLQESCSLQELQESTDDDDDDDDDFLDPLLELDIEQQLKRNLKTIMAQYAAYVDRILTILKEKNICSTQLASFLLNNFAYDSQRKSHMADMKAELERANSIEDIIFLLSAKYSSFLDCSIFDSILEHYGTNERHENLEYSMHLKEYIEAHKIIEFIKLNPKLEKFERSGSVTITIKFNIKSTRNLSTLKEVTCAVANILGVQASAIRLIGVKKGCVCATYLIPTSMADSIFTGETVFTEEQQDKFLKASVVWLECNQHKFNFKENRDTADTDTTIATNKGHINKTRCTAPGSCIKSLHTAMII